MRVLLDEDVPKQLLEPLRHLTRGRHEVVHVADTRLKGRKDVPLLKEAARQGFEAVVTNDAAQLDDPAETRAIKQSGLHHVRYSQRHHGLRGLALALGALVAELPSVLDELPAASSQRLVRIQGLDPSRKRYEIVDPSQEPPKYWPRGRGDGRRRRPSPH
jgi:hypothetical protein